MRYLAVLLALSAACHEPAPEKKAATTSVGESAATNSSRKLEDTNGMGSAAPGASASAGSTSQASADFNPELSARGGLWGDDDPRVAIVPKIRMAAISVTGRLPPEVIQRIVRQNFGRLRLCYEKALAKDPSIFGRITTTFVIDTTGASKDFKATGEVSDKDMLACVQKTFTGLSFPAPEGGVVKVSYPIMFAAPEYTFTINDKPSGTVREVDVVKALEAAGYKVVGAATLSEPTTTVSRFKAEKADVTFSITLDPVAKLSLEAYKKLKTEAVLLQDGAWCLFVESGDKTASQALVDSIHKKLATK